MLRKLILIIQSNFIHVIVLFMCVRMMAEKLATMVTRKSMKNQSSKAVNIFDLYRTSLANPIIPLITIFQFGISFFNFFRDIRGLLR